MYKINLLLLVVLSISSCLRGKQDDLKLKVNNIAENIEVFANEEILVPVEIISDNKLDYDKYFTLSISDGTLILNNSIEGTSITGKLSEGKALCFLKPSKDIKSNIVITLTVDEITIKKTLNYVRVYPKDFIITAEKHIASPSESILIQTELFNDGGFISTNLPVKYEIISNQGGIPNGLINQNVFSIQKLGKEIAEATLTKAVNTDTSRVTLRASVQLQDSIILSKEILIRYE